VSATGSGTVEPMSRQGKGVAAVAGCAILLAATVALALAPARAGALDSDLKHSYAFKLEASNGYSILAYAGSERVDGRGEIVLFVRRGSAGAIYQAPATVTAARIDADLGRLGEVALDVVPSGRERTVGTPCDPESGPATYEPQTFQGGFEFHGEEGYTEAVSPAPKESMRFFLDLYCASAGGGSAAVAGRDLRGAKLSLRAHRGQFHLEVEVNKNRPGGRTRFEVGLRERREGIFILRSRTLWLGGDAFRFDRELRTATVVPPAPFAGRASFHRGAADVWAGDLTVDMPGRSDVPLAGTGIEAALVPFCRHESEGSFRC